MQVNQNDRSSTDFDGRSISQPIFHRHTLSSPLFFLNLRRNSLVLDHGFLGKCYWARHYIVPSEVLWDFNPFPNR